VSILVSIHDHPEQVAPDDRLLTSDDVVFVIRGRRSNPGNAAGTAPAAIQPSFPDVDDEEEPTWEDAEWQ
jgi:hypothetical protein